MIDGKLKKKKKNGKQTLNFLPRKKITKNFHFHLIIKQKAFIPPKKLKSQ